MSSQTPRFIDEAISVEYDTEQVRVKTPTCPNVINWRGQQFRIIQALEEWSDFTRRGRSARNMRPAHLASAVRAGSWGVGRFYFKVVVEGGEVFVIYYDRAPEDVDNRLGQWFLFSLQPANPGENNPGTQPS